MADGAARADLIVSGEGGSALHSLKGVGVESPGNRNGRELLGTLPSLDRLEEAKEVTVDLSVPGTCLHGGKAHRVEKLFVISVDAWASGAGTVTLRTFSDAWMSHDLRGHKQSDVQAENAPRLSTVLSGLTRLTEAETIPGDPTLYGIPTDCGFEDLPDEDSDLLDSWYMFEVPRRTEALRAHLPSKGAPLGEPDPDSRVRFAEVGLGGRVIGFLWATIDERASGYEPYTPAGDAALDAALTWLARLSEARERGATPSQALRELSALPSDDAQSGLVVPGSLREAASLEYVQDLSGRE
ncbi:hypothetical protein AB0I54_03735 [Streptomyces sp. NPDC050625]|uniref:hypothetical protein n=1 Tax=Streptomyces sp. NPDC050625 TaxID=3154629 RepID=UPI003417EF65